MWFAVWVETESGSLSYSAETYLPYNHEGGVKLFLEAEAQYWSCQDAVNPPQFLNYEILLCRQLSHSLLSFLISCEWLSVQMSKFRPVEMGNSTPVIIIMIIYEDRRIAFFISPAAPG